MRKLAFVSLALVSVITAISVTVRADASDCVTLGECAEGITWDVQVGPTETTITIHHPNEDPIVEVQPNDSKQKVSGHGVSVKPSGGGTWGAIINCAGTTYGCA